jgi:hypothetical protein
MIASEVMSNTSEKTHRPVQDYVYRIPGPPAVSIPAPIVDDAEEISITKICSHNCELTGFANLDFLHTVDYANFNPPNSVLDWNYQERWTAQAVLPFLYLGPVSIAKDGTFLQQHGITMMLRIRTVLMSGAKSLDVTVADPKVEVYVIDVGGIQDLIAAFPRAIDMINAHLATLFKNHERAPATSGLHATSPPGKVLVCCETGNERSPCLVAAYLMAIYAMDFVKAIQIVQAQRFSAIFGEESRNMLQTYHTILQAQRNVVQSNKATHINWVSGSAEKDEMYNRGENSASSPAKANKRSLDELYNDETDTESPHVDDLGPAVGKREGHAPFQDGRG